MSKLSDSALSRLLDVSSTKDYFIEYEGFLTNHDSHAVIALYLLGATEQQIEAFHQHYIKRLEPNDGPTAIKQGELDNPEKGLGQRKGFNTLIKHYQTKLDTEHGGDVDAFLKVVFPKLLPGWASGALHQIIHTGYGYYVRNSRLIVEGVAYMHHSFREFKFDGLPASSMIGKGDTPMLDLLTMIHEDKDIFHYMRTAEKPSEFRGFQPNMVALMNDPEKKIQKYTYKLKIPEEHLESPAKILRWLLDQSITVFTASERRNDFFLLHGVTSTWAMTNFIHLLSKEHQMDALRLLVTALCAVYLVQGRPALKLGYLDDPAIKNVTWDYIKKEALALDMKTTDEHIYKVTQVCFCLSQEEGLTDQQKDLYKLGAMSSIREKLLFFSVPSL